MHQFVQSAIEAANQGDKKKATEFIQQVLAANPNDVDAWLVLAAVVDEPERKRQCLKRVLTLDPINQLAREEMLEMDRADMGGNPTFMPNLEPVSPIMPEVAASPTKPASSSTSQSSGAKPSNKMKPLVFKIPITTRLFIYFITVLGLVMTVSALAANEWEIALSFFVAFLIMCFMSWGFSGQIKVNEAGILVDSLISQSRIDWNEISEIKSGSFQQGLELKRTKGKSVKVTGAVSGYQTIVDTLRQKRPDLFGMTTPNNTSPTFAGSKTYKKTLLMQYSGILVGVPMLILCVLVVLNGYSEFFFVGIFLGLYSIYLIFQPFFHAYEIKLEPNHLVFETFFEQKEYSAAQIENIWIKTVRGRYGSAFHYVMVKPIQGRTISLRGFGIGEEILYGCLINWWDTYKNK